MEDPYALLLFVLRKGSGFFVQKLCKGIRKIGFFRFREIRRLFREKVSQKAFKTHQAREDTEPAF